MCFLILITPFFGESSPPDDTVDDDMNVLPGMEQKYNAYLRGQKIKHIIGYIVTLIVIAFCLIYLNLQAAVLGEDVTLIWFIICMTELFMDVFIIKPLKCLLYYICTRPRFLKILIDILSSGLNVSGLNVGSAIGDD